MAIKIPGRRISPKAALKEVQKQMKAKGKRTTFASLTLTSMVDMFTLLVIFLLSNFSASGELLLSSKDITLPKAVSTNDLERAAVIAISAMTVSVEGQKVGDSADILKDEDPRIQDLVDKLVEQKRVVTQMMGPDKFKGQVIIQADGNIDFRLVKKVMYSATEAGYTGFQYAVTSASQAAAQPQE